MRIEQLSSHALTARLGELLATERQTIAEFVLHLAELERRRLHLELGYPSLFAFCVEHLKLTKASAFRRTTAARLVARHPELTQMLRDGRLCLTTLVELREVLGGDDHAEILARAAGRTEEQIRELVAVLRPQPPLPDLFRRLPQPAQPPSSGPEPPKIAIPVPTAPPAGAPNDLPGARPPTAAATLRPLSGELHVLRVTVGRQFAEDLATVRSLLSHNVPGGKLEDVLHECIRRTIATCEKRRAAVTSRPARHRPTTGRTIAAHVRREVWRRDAGACTFIGTTGKRCGSTYELEFHHLTPFARGGPSTAENLTLRCRAHNLYAAELEPGVGT